MPVSRSGTAEDLSAWPCTGSGNILWDCINVLTPETKERIQQLGGIQAIAISHPHFYTGMAAWAEAFDAPVYVHEKDRQWVTQPSERITFWSGALPRQWSSSCNECNPAVHVVIPVCLSVCL